MKKNKQNKEFYCLVCHDFTIYKEESEGNGNTGEYCIECGSKVYSRYSSSVISDLKHYTRIIDK